MLTRRVSLSGEREQPGPAFLERISRAIEANPDAHEETLWRRAVVTRKSGDEAFALLVTAGFTERCRVNDECRSRSLRSFRTDDFSAPEPRAA